MMGLESIKKSPQAFAGNDEFKVWKIHYHRAFNSSRNMSEKKRRTEINH